MGIVDSVVPDNELLSQVLRLAANISAKSPAVIATFLTLFRNSLNTKTDQLAEFETESFAELWVKPDFQNWLRKFAEQGRKSKGKRLRDKGKK